MYVRMLQAMSGRNVDLRPNEYVEVSAEIGKAWVGAGIAEDASKNPDAKSRARKFTPDKKNYNEAAQAQSKKEQKSMEEQAEGSRPRRSASATKAAQALAEEQAKKAKKAAASGDDGEGELVT